MRGRIPSLYAYFLYRREIRALLRRRSASCKTWNHYSREARKKSIVLRQFFHHGVDHRAHGKRRRAELTLWDAANRYLRANLPKGTKTLPIAEWEQEYADLKTQRDSDYTKLKDTRAEVAELQKIRKCVDIALRADQPEQTQSRTKRHDIDR